MVVGTSRRLRVAAAVVLVALAATACTPDGEAPPDTRPPAGPVLLSVAVYGPAPLISTYAKIAARFTARNPNIVVSLRPYDTLAEEIAATRRSIAAGHGPSLFLADQSDLPMLQHHKLVTPVDALLGERQVDFGDGYARDALETFSGDAALQCMPTALSPLVVYYNKQLVHLKRTQDPGGSPVTPDTGWSMSEFVRAARQASHHGTRGVYIAPDLDQVAPFVWAGGGSVTDDPNQPRTLSMSSSASTSALVQLLELVRNPHVTFGQEQLDRRSALQRFEGGQLGMILGYRGLTPVLRKQPDLQFDVMPLPNLKTRATSGDVQAMCLTRTRGNPGPAADFLAYLVSSKPMTLLARTGYLMPTNLEVTSSKAFTQPDRRPRSASVFSDQVRRIRHLPDGARWRATAAMAHRRLVQLFYDPVIDPLKDRLAALDAQSATMLAPSPTPSPSPSATPSPGSSPSPS